MKDLSISQKYFLCVLNDKGKLPSIDATIEVCILAGSLFDLMFLDCVKVGEDKKIYINKELDSSLQHLESLYAYIQESKPMKVDKLASEYYFSFNEKRKKQLFSNIGTSLVTSQVATYEKGGFFGNVDFYFPNRKYVDNIIENIRAELLEDGCVSDDIIALVSLLEKSNQIKRYFSAYEKDKLKIRLKEIKESDSHKVVKEMVDYIDGLIAVFVACVAIN